MSVDVTDTGIGISTADQQHVFSAFHRSTNPNALSIPGTGLGPADRAAHRGVARRDAVECPSELGQGSTFTLHAAAALAARRDRLTGGAVDRARGAPPGPSSSSPTVPWVIQTTERPDPRRRVEHLVRDGPRGGGVEVGGRLVEHEHGRVRQQRAWPGPAAPARRRTPRVGPPRRACGCRRADRRPTGRGTPGRAPRGPRRRRRPGGPGVRSRRRWRRRRAGRRRPARPRLVRRPARGRAGRCRRAAPRRVTGSMKRTRVAARVDFPRPGRAGDRRGARRDAARGARGPAPGGPVAPSRAPRRPSDTVGGRHRQGRGGSLTAGASDGEPVEPLAGRTCAHRQGTRVGQPAGDIGQGERARAGAGPGGRGRRLPGLDRGLPRRPRRARLPRR